MLRYLVTILFISFFQPLSAQHSLKLLVTDKQNGEALSQVSVVFKDAPLPAKITGEGGSVIFQNIPAGNYTIEVSYTGYVSQLLKIRIPDTVAVHLVQLLQDKKAMDAVVVVASTRSNDRIENATTKVEVLGQEEMNEESTLKPGNIASILGDLSGVQIQQSSAVSGNSNVRIQGLDGRYTQVLKDGMPLYGGYSGGFGVLSIPPLDLKQVELIKGSSSTLYGGGAIAGLVNLVSKKPSYDPDASFLVNQTTLKETNINAFYSQRGKKAGFTFFGGQTIQGAADVDKDGFSDVAKTSSTLIHPVVFIYPSTKTYFSLGWSGSFEKRTGGDMIAIEGKNDPAHPYFETNNLNRNSFTLMGESRVNNTLTLVMKSSLSIFKREETTNTYLFNGKQNNYYAELSLVKRSGKHIIVGGINATGEDFSPSAKTPVPVGNFSSNTVGAFVQDSWQFIQGSKLETGLRVDHHDQYGNFVLPRIALFHRFSKEWGARAGFGMGYTTPNPLTIQVKDYSIYQLQKIPASAGEERSFGLNAELNYKKQFGEESSIFINHAFFVTQVNNPLTASEDISGNVSFNNQEKPLVTKGFDTYVQAKINSWEIYLGYTYTDAVRTYLPFKKFVPITPRNRAATTLLYEREGKWRVGLEASYNGYQYREDYSKTPSFLFMAAMAEKKFGPKWSLVLNCENLLDERQSRHEALYSGSIADPSFKTLWGPIDGRIVNLCLRFQPFAKGE